MSEFPADKQESIINLFKAFNEYYPDAVLQHRLSLFKKHLDETYFAWIGEFGDEDPYYYRIHSPVAFMELDFHCGSESPIHVSSPPGQHSLNFGLGMLICSSFLDKHDTCKVPYPYSQQVT